MRTTMFLIGQETMGIVPEYDAFGDLHAKVLLPEEYITVGESPTQLIDRTLRMQGTSFRGARDGANYILSRTHNTPVRIEGEETIILFPTTSPSREDCTWFALHHIDCYEAVGKGKTCVTLTNGHTVTLPVSKFSFHNQFQKALRFKYQLVERRTVRMFLVREPKKRYHLMKRDGGRNFEDS
ncbi:competence protein ComK [Bhargavaea massiliensis]|uniref:competence protein ComK n=1 Tax=Bhargavaea massiliensis TaxID=2697500 RepID=UPI001BD03E13|nr:competence protein ComK [Bhargavaea massiliensis]